MTRVLVAIKRVVESSGEVVLTPDEQGMDGRFAGYTIGEHDACATELAIQIAESTAGTVTVLSVGTTEAVEQIRSALALGAAAGVLVEADPVALGPADVAAEIAAVMADAREAGAPFDLVLLGNDAADTGDFQVPVRLAYAAGLPVVTGASRAEVGDGVLVAQVKGPYGEETYEVPLPAVVSVLEGGVEPRYPSLRGRMAAKKVEVQIRTATGSATGSGRVRWHVPPPAPSTTQVLGEGPGAAPAVVDVLRGMAVVP